MPKPFIDIEMPGEFVLECLTPDGNWIDWVKGVKTRIRLQRPAFAAGSNKCALRARDRVQLVVLAYQTGIAGSPRT